jgi:predicted site-specific integrase-resolvase
MNWVAQTIITKTKGISRTMLYEWSKAGIVKKSKVGKRVFFDVEQIDAHINNNLLTPKK